MKYAIFALTFCLMTMIPQESFAVLAPVKENAPAYKEVTRAEKKAFRKYLRKRIKATKKATPPRGFDSYYAMGLTFSLVGLAAIIVGWLLNIGIIYSLGGLVLTIGLIILILYWLGVV